MTRSIHIKMMWTMFIAITLRFLLSCWTLHAPVFLTAFCFCWTSNVALPGTFCNWMSVWNNSQFTCLNTLKYIHEPSFFTNHLQCDCEHGISVWKVTILGNLAKIHVSLFHAALSSVQLLMLYDFSHIYQYNVKQLVGIILFWLTDEVWLFYDVFNWDLQSFVILLAYSESLMTTATPDLSANVWLFLLGLLIQSTHKCSFQCLPYYGHQ